MDVLEKLLSSRVRAGVLRQLFNDGGTKVHLRELARRIEFSPSAVDQDLKNLTAMRLVKKDPDGNRTYYSANRTHPLFHQIQNLVVRESSEPPVYRITRKKRPAVHIVAGANGSGKTTFAMHYLPAIARCRNFINADLIASGISPLDVDSAAMEAGKLFIRKIDEEIRSVRDVAFETTLSGRRFIRLFDDLKARDYMIHLYFLWIPSPGLALKRVADRVRLGGHDIPPAVVRRRYSKGIKNLFGLYMEMTDYCAIFDNSLRKPVLVFERLDTGENILRPEIFRRICEKA